MSDTHSTPLSVKGVCHVGSTTRLCTRVALTFAFAVVLVGTVAVAEPGAPDSVPTLIEAVGPRVFADPSEVAVRSRLVQLDLTVVQSFESTETPRIRLEIFEEASVVVRFDELRQTRPGSQVWLGRIEGDPQSRVMLSTHGTAAFLFLRSERLGQYEVVPHLDGDWILRQVDPLLYQGCATDDDEAGVSSEDGPSESPTPWAGVQQSGCTDDGSTIDVLVVYTNEAAQANGGRLGMEALAAAAIEAGNDAYANSLISPRLRLVAVREVDYVESGDSLTDLQRLRIPGGYLAEVQPLRDAVKADVVALIVDDLDACGQAAFAVQFGGVSDPELAYSVVKDSCAASNWTLAHEIGHNQGSRHSIRDDDDDGAYVYSHGHEVQDKFRTVMAIRSPYVDDPAREPYYSNPSVYLQGSPTGIPDVADNARSIDNTAFTVANFRCCPEVNAFGDCVVPTCPATYGCTIVGLGSSSCTEQVPLQCHTVNFGTDHCKTATRPGELVLCPGGVVADRCTCQNNLPGQLCRNENQTFRCIP